MVKVGPEAPARWRKPPGNCYFPTLDKRASPRLYLPMGSVHLHGAQGKVLLGSVRRKNVACLFYEIKSRSFTVQWRQVNGRINQFDINRSLPFLK